MIHFLFTVLPESLVLGQWSVGDVSGLVGAVTGVAALVATCWPLYQQRCRQRLLEREFGAELYQPTQIENAARYYVRPYCSSIDPAQEGEMRRVFMTKEELFVAIDRYIRDETAHRHILLLADAGMGKSSFVLNYYARNQQMWRRRRQRLAVIPLGRPEALDEIAKIDNQKNTVLFLDALDEDTRAIHDYRARLQELMQASSRFKRVLITCRTQFFPKDDEIPQQTGIARVDPRKPGEGSVYEFWKLYILPLDDRQVEKYLRRRYRLWAWSKRRQSRAAVAKVPLLSVRPMLLAYIPDLLEDKGVVINFSVQLYEQMVKKWVERERDWFKDYDLLAFSKELAVDLYVNSERRQSERITRKELSTLLSAHPIPIDEWKITGRSLLNRDSSGHYKFSHRSIMEYLFISKYMEGDARCRGIKWTDMMKQFFLELVYIHYRDGGPPIKFAGADLTETEGVNIPPLYQLRERPITVPELRQGLIPSRVSDDVPLVHVFAVQHRSDGDLVTDHAAGLVWQRTGSSEMLNITEAGRYVEDLNASAHCGYSNWRLPTADELVFTMRGEGAASAPFDDRVLTIWTSDQTLRGDTIYLLYAQLRSQSGDDALAYVRAVRSVTPTADQLQARARAPQPQLLAPAV